MLDFQVSTIVFTVINLLVLYFILRKLLFGRVNAVLEQRAARVKETIDSAEASKCQAEELRAEYEDKLTDARQEAAKLVADAQNRAQRAYEAKMADAETDAKIRQQLKEKMGSATTILISHRITTLMQADRILVLDNGRVADLGTHEELIARPGIYRDIYEIQMNNADRELLQKAAAGAPQGAVTESR